MHAKQKRHLFGLQSLRSGHIRQDHKFFNQAMRIQTIAKIYRGHLPVFIQDDFAFGQIQLKRLANFARPNQGGVSLI